MFLFNNLSFEYNNVNFSNDDLLHSHKMTLGVRYRCTGRRTEQSTAAIRRTRTTKIHCFAFGFSSFRLYFCSYAGWLGWLKNIMKIKLPSPAGTAHCLRTLFNVRSTQLTLKFIRNISDAKLKPNSLYVDRLAKKLWMSTGFSSPIRTLG